MTLSVASSIAYSALRAAEVGISVTSANIANADVDGYTVKTAVQVSTVSNGVGTGTAISEITGGVDKYVFASYLSAASDLGAASIAASYTDSLQQLLGSTSDDDGGSSFAGAVSDLETAVSSLSSDPDSATAKSEVVDAAATLAASLSETSSSIQQLRADADQQIADDVDTVNETLTTIGSLNDAIIRASAAGQSTADLTDKLDSALKTLSSLMDVKTTTTASGAVHVYTSSGTALVNGSVHELSYSPASSVDAGTSFGAIGVEGEDITGEITSGEISGLVTLRDETLVEAQAELDALASSVISGVNGALADGSAVPAPSSLTGSTSRDGEAALSASGSVRIAVVDEDGTLISSTDLDLSAYATVDDLVSALDGIDGINASLGTDGKLTLSSTADDTGVAVAALDGALGDDGDSFSSYFGLNSLFAGSSASDIAVSGALADDSGLLATGSLSEDAGVGDTGLATAASDGADALYDLLTGDTAFAAAGGIGATRTSFADYAALIVGDFADRASDAETTESTADTLASTLSDTLSSTSGVNVDEETSKLSDYQTLYQAAAQVIEIANEMFSTLLEAVKSST